MLLNEFLDGASKLAEVLVSCQVDASYFPINVRK